MKTFKVLVVGLLTVITLTQCTKLVEWEGYSLKSDTEPKVVTDVKVENIIGGAILKYTLPIDNNLINVKAVYKLDEADDPIEYLASAYTNTMKLEGFPDVKEYSIDLIAIYKLGRESEPVNVKIFPLEPPSPPTPTVELIKRTLSFKSVFGGIRGDWINETMEDIDLSLYVKDGNGDFVLQEAYNSNAIEGSYAFRGLDAVEQEFRIIIEDQNDNSSEPYDTVLKPLFEERIKGMDENGNLIWSRYGFDNGEAKWRGDIVTSHAKGFDQMVDGIYSYDTKANIWNSGGKNFLELFTDDGSHSNVEVIPMYLTIDLGSSVKLSRHKIWHRGAAPIANKNPTYYEIWATNDTPKSPADFSSIEDSWKYWTSWSQVGGQDSWKQDWTRIAVCDPMTIPEVIDNDGEWVKNNGLEFIMDPETTEQNFRYIRMEFQKNWEGTSHLQIGEFELWGAYD